MQDHISAPEAAKRWDILERRVQRLYEDDHRPSSRMRLIPKNTEKPVDRRHTYRKIKDGKDK